MSQENVNLVRRGIQDVTFWALLDEYVVWDLREYPILDLESIYVGREAVRGLAPLLGRLGRVQPRCRGTRERGIERCRRRARKRPWKEQRRSLRRFESG